MLFTSTLSLVLALAPTALLAAPTKTVESIAQLSPRQDLPKAVLDQLVKTNGLCDLSNVVLPPAPTPLAPISEGASIRMIVIGRGTQNYTCSSSSAQAAPVAQGAVAQLFNATCDYARLNDAVMADFTAMALKYSVPTGKEAEQRHVGHHEFTDKGVPLFWLKTDTVDFGYIQAKPDAIKSAAPKDASKGSNGLGSVPWLKLNAVEGDYKEVYRVHTAGGVAPKTCEGIEGSFTVEYSAQYWFYA